MKIIGLTGGIGSGKSTVSGFLSEMGVAVLDADKIGHEALKPGSEARERVVKEFGEDIVTAGGEIDRAKLGDLVFNDDEARTRLNRIMHPAIYSMIKARLKEYDRQGVDEVVIEAPVLIEAGWLPLVHEVWVTVAPEDTIIRRVRERTGLSESEARARISSQLSSEERIKHANEVIDTDCSLDELKRKVLGLWVDHKTRFSSFMS